MTIRQVSYTSRQKAEALPGSPSTAVISITDPGTPEADLSPAFQHVLRLSFFDAVPADEFLPAPFPGLFDHLMAREISQFVKALHDAAEDYAVLVHCEYGVSRSAAVALFVEAYSGAPLLAREYTSEANQWVVDRLSQVQDVDIDIPLYNPAVERRQAQRY